MKDHNYYNHIGIGVPLDKLQEGNFDYENRKTEGTLSEFAKKIRDTVEDMAKDKNKSEVK